jgi:outer membrane protein assembly factor BamB
MSPDTLAPQWTSPIGRNGTRGHSLAPIQDGSRVFVLTDQDVTAFAASDGTILWTTFGGQETHGCTLPTDYGLLIQSLDYKLELRDSSSGEVRRVWPQIHGASRLAVHDQFAAVAAFDGTLWIVDLRDSRSALQ